MPTAGTTQARAIAPAIVLRWGMATRLIQVLSFANVPAGGNAMLVHQINVNGEPKRPDFTALSTQGFSAVVTTTTVTVTNNNAAPANVDVWLELKHTIPRQLGSSLTTEISAQPFVASGGGSAGVDVRDEGLAIPNNPHPIFDFVGAGVIATDMGGGVARITIPGGGGIAGINVLEDGVILPGSPYTNIDFVGPNVTATDVLGVATVSVLSGLIAGSVLFAGAGSAVSQDNANFFWDDTNNRLGIGNAAPAQALHVTGTVRASAGLTLDTLTTGSVLFSGASGAVSQDNANFFWDDATNRLGIRTNVPGAPLHVVGDSQFFDGQIYSRRDHATDGPAFFQNNNGANTGPSAVGFLNQAGTFKTYVGFFPSAYAFTHYQNKNGIFCFTGEDLVVGDAANVTAVFNHTDNSVGIGIANPATIFTDTKLGVESTSGHSLVSIRTLVASSDAVINLATLTSVDEDASIFLDETDARKLKFVTGNVTTDALRNTNTRMVIDQTGRVGIGTTTPDVAYQLNVQRAVAGQGVALMRSTSATGFSTINFANHLGTFILGVGHDNASSTSYIDGALSPNPFLISHSLSANLAMNLRNLSVSGYSATQFLNNVSAAQGSLGYANASVGLTHLAGNLYWFSNAANIVFGNSTRNEHTFGMTGGSAFYQMANGAGAAAGDVNTARLRYNDTVVALQSSLDGALYFNIPQLEAALTAGSVLFANASGRIAQDNANFFWDDTSNRLGIGTTTPAEVVDARVGNASGYSFGAANLNAGGYSGTSFYKSDGVFQGSLGWGNASVPFTHLQDAMFWMIDLSSATSNNMVLANDTQVEHRFGIFPDQAYHELNNGEDATTSNAGTARIIYNETAGTLQVSFNGAAFVTIQTV